MQKGGGMEYFMKEESKNVYEKLYFGMVPKSFQWFWDYTFLSKNFTINKYLSWDVRKLWLKYIFWCDCLCLVVCTVKIKSRQSMRKNGCIKDCSVEEKFLEQCCKAVFTVFCHCQKTNVQINSMCVSFSVPWVCNLENLGEIAWWVIWIS